MSDPQPVPPKDEILVVDDDLASLRLLRSMLAERGYRARGARDGPTALMIARENPPDLVLLDVIMPGMDGYEVCRQLRSEAKTRNIPVIFVSALGELVDKVKGFEVGGVDYITKPFEPTEVFAHVKAHLTIRATQTELEVANRQLGIAQDELERLNAELEERVRQRTVELEHANEALQENQSFGEILLNLSLDKA